MRSIMLKIRKRYLAATAALYFVLFGCALGVAINFGSRLRTIESDHKMEIQALETELTAQKGLTDTYQASAEALVNQNAQLQGEYVALQAQIAELENKVIDVSNQLASTQNRLQAERSERQRLEREARAAEEAAAEQNGPFDWWPFK